MAKATENRWQFRELAELLPQTDYEVGTSGNLRYVNAKGPEQLGYRRADVDVGANALDMIIPADRGRAFANLSRSWRGSGSIAPNTRACARVAPLSPVFFT